ncbi:hypothetical protein [Fuscibacter oryzae]|uniref:Uncharacterized protein n=1 Tax=Fuscibacter oryzae TaxID=2803939 RepID=A0A8J7SU61_9RHOB|nr:hypothetical protein [Fuscibacter oryzae]MBL4927286.1 hypothetical protein [Fuscibacter oryzae]
MSWWTLMTEAQATIISGVLTVLAGIIAALLGGWVFSKKVKSLEDAISDANDKLGLHVEGFKKEIDKLGERLKEIQEVTQETGEKVIRQNADIVDRQEAVQDLATSPDGDLKSKFSEAWEVVRSAIEDRAVDPSIDGRTRAKYLRIDRRQYRDLANALRADGNLNLDEGSVFGAIELRQSYRNGRRVINIEDVAKMKTFSDAIQT